MARDHGLRAAAIQEFTVFSPSHYFPVDTFVAQEPLAQLLEVIELVVLVVRPSHVEHIGLFIAWISVSSGLEVSVVEIYDFCVCVSTPLLPIHPAHSHLPQALPSST